MLWPETQRGMPVLPESELRSYSRYIASGLSATWVADSYALDVTVTQAPHAALPVPLLNGAGAELGSSLSQTWGETCCSGQLPRCSPACQVCRRAASTATAGWQGAGYCMLHSLLLQNVFIGCTAMPPLKQLA